VKLYNSPKLSFPGNAASLTTTNGRDKTVKEALSKDVISNSRIIINFKVQKMMEPSPLCRVGRNIAEMNIKKIS
jgi:hypothetical protein